MGEAVQKKLLLMAFALAVALGFAFSLIDARTVETNWNFGKLPKGSPVPPSGPSGGTTPPARFLPYKNWHFGKLPKGTPVPPSGPSGGTTPPARFFGYKNWNFVKLPKGTPIPPSGPSTRTSDPPPPPARPLGGFI